MAFRIDDSVPIPGSSREGASNEASETIKKLKEGQSFFIPSTLEERPIIQKRITVMGVTMRKKGKIDFFLVTRRTTEKIMEQDEHGADTGEEVEVDGIRVWRREKGIEEDDE